VRNSPRPKCWISERLLLGDRKGRSLLQIAASLRIIAAAIKDFPDFFAKEG
jgi:hypothetical protein